MENKSLMDSRTAKTNPVGHIVQATGIVFGNVDAENN